MMRFYYKICIMLHCSNSDIPNGFLIELCRLYLILVREQKVVQVETLEAREKLDPRGVKVPQGHPQANAQCKPFPIFFLSLSAPHFTQVKPD